MPLVILDTDIGSSTDDLFALEMLFRYEEAGKCRLLGVVVDRPGEANAAFADAMNAWAGPARETYLDAIRPRLSEGCYRAAVSRLDDVIAHAEALQRDGKVLEGNGWLDLPERPLGTGDNSVRKQNGGTKRFDGTIALNIHILSSPSYFARDCLDKLFA
ncbi:MAG: hypothetical protein IJQ73_10485 [Kiritimatiellae bacterium]|nr:hypothetical protein [Kiritimatiellia bacterium]